MVRTERAWAGVGVVLSGGAVLGAGATFRGVGALDSENFSSSALAVTDQRVVAGGTSVPGGGGAAFLMSADGTMSAIGAMSVRGLSSDASIVVGRSFDSTSRPTYWTEATGVRTLPVLSMAGPGEASAVSADGSVIVGRTGGTRPAGSTNPPPMSRAVRWVNGVIQDLGSLGTGPGYPLGGTSQAMDVSADGGVVVGTTDLPYTGGGFPGDAAFVWTEAGGMVSLGDLPGGEVRSRGQAVSADGRVVVGTGVGTNGTEAFRWTSETGMVGIGRLVANGNVGVFDVSGDGSVIVGLGAGPSFENQRAAVWHSRFGWRDVREMLVAEHGLDLTGWVLEGAYGVSPDGKAIVGVGKNPEGKTEGWIAVLPELGAGVGDANADGRVDADDYVLVDRGHAMGLRWWRNGDFDGDGAVGAGDYLLIDAAYARRNGGVLSAGLLAEREGQFGAGYVAELVAAVPEPGVAGAVLVWGVVGVGRRRGRW